MTTRVEYGVPSGNDFVNPKSKMPEDVKSGETYVFYPKGSALGRLFGRQYYKVTVEDRTPKDVTLVHLESTTGISKWLYQDALSLTQGGQISRTISANEGFRVTDVKS